MWRYWQFLVAASQSPWLHAVSGSYAVPCFTQYDPAMSFVPEPMGVSRLVHAKPVGHAQYAEPSSVLPSPFAQRHEQYTARLVLRSTHCGETCAFRRGSLALPVTGTIVPGVTQAAPPAGAEPLASCPYGHDTRPRK